MPTGDSAGTGDAGPFTVIWSGVVLHEPVASQTWIEKSKVPVVVGVPEIAPVDLFRLNPSGNTPDTTAHVYGPVPPLTVKVKLQDCMSVHGVSDDDVVTPDTDKPLLPMRFRGLLPTMGTTLSGMPS